MVGPIRKLAAKPKGERWREGRLFRSYKLENNVAGDKTEKAMSISFDFEEQVGPSKRAKNTPQKTPVVYQSTYAHMCRLVGAERALTCGEKRE